MMVSLLDVENPITGRLILVEEVLEVLKMIKPRKINLILCSKKYAYQLDSEWIS